MTLDDIQRRLADLLRNAGCQTYTARQALDDMAECWRDIHEDAVTRGERETQPFFNYIVAEGVGIFALFRDETAIYIVQGSEQEFRESFEPLALAEVEQAHSLLQSEYGRPEPDLVVEPALNKAWFASSAG